MSALSAVKADDEVFTTRVREVNQEMDQLLKRTTQSGQQLSRAAAEVRIGVASGFYGPAYDRSSITASVDPIPPPRRDDLARSVVSAELSQWAQIHLPSLVEQLVDARVEKQLRTYHGEVKVVQHRLMEAERTVQEMAESAKEHRQGVDSAVAAQERATRVAHRRMQEEIHSREQHLSLEVALAKESVEEIRSSAAAAVHRTERIVSEAVQRQKSAAEDSLLHLEEELRRWKTAVKQLFENDIESLGQAHGELEKQVAAIQGVQCSISEVVTQCSIDLQRLMADAVERSSEVRSCIRNVNRVELLLDYTVPGAFRAEQPSPSNTASERNANPDGGTHVLTHQVVENRERIFSMMRRVDGLERMVRQLELALLRSGGGMGWGGRASLYGSVRGDAYSESSFSRTPMSTRRPSFSQGSTLAGMPPSPKSGQRPPLFNHPGYSVAGSDDTAASVTVDGGAARSLPQPLSLWRAGVIPDSSGIGSVRVNSNDGAAQQHQDRQQHHPPHRAHPQQIAAPLFAHSSVAQPSFDSTAEDQDRPMPIALRRADSAPGWVSKPGLAAQTSPAQRRQPPKVLSVEEEEVDEASGSEIQSLRSSSSLHSGTSSSHDEPNNFAVQRPLRATHNSMSTSSSHIAGSLSSTPPQQSAALGSSLQQVEKESTGYGFSVQASSPSDSYVSDTPPARLEPVDRGSSGAGSMRSPGGPLDDTALTPNSRSCSISTPLSDEASQRYTPAPACDSESERDNVHLSRLALD